MKHLRILPWSIAPVLAFALMMGAAQTSIHPKPVNESIHSAGGQQPGPDDCPQQPGPSTTCQVKTDKKTVAIYLHGLMVGRFQRGNKRFELGVVKRAIDHRFAFNLFDVDDNKLIKPSCNLENVLKGNKKNWVFEIQAGNSKEPIEPLVPYESGPEPSHKACIPPSNKEDYRHILNIEKDMHTGRLGRFKRPFNPVFYFKNGTVKTASLTDCLKAQMVERDKVECASDIGQIAEVVKVVITLKRGQKLVLRTEDNSIILWENENTKDEGEIEGRVLNLPWSPLPCSTCYLEKSYECMFTCLPTHANSINHDPANGSNLPNATDPNEPEGPPATHFQYYYSLVFQKNRPDRFELINPKPSQEILDPADREYKTTVSPYLCGMVLVNKDSSPIKVKN